MVFGPKAPSSKRRREGRGEGRREGREVKKTGGGKEGEKPNIFCTEKLSRLCLAAAVDVCLFTPGGFSLSLFRAFFLPVS